MAAARVVQAPVASSHRGLFSHFHPGTRPACSTHLCISGPRASSRVFTLIAFKILQLSACVNGRVGPLFLRPNMTEGARAVAQSHWEDEDILFYFEFDEDRWVLRQVELKGPMRTPISATALSEMPDARTEGLDAVREYEDRYGGLADQPMPEDLDLPQETSRLTSSRMSGGVLGRSLRSNSDMILTSGQSADGRRSRFSRSGAPGAVAQSVRAADS